jgi:hypothetical protein
MIMALTKQDFEELEFGHQVLIYFFSQCANRGLRRFNAAEVLGKLFDVHDVEGSGEEWWNITDKMALEADGLISFFEEMYPDAISRVMAVVEEQTAGVNRVLH